MKSQLAIAALTVAALTACGSGSDDGAAIEPSTPPEVSTSLPPPPDTEPATSDVDDSSTTSDNTTASTTPIAASTSPPPTSNEVVPPTNSTAIPVSTEGQQGPVVGLRLDDDVALFDVAVLQEIDFQATIDAMSGALGAPTSMTEWAPMPEPLAAIGVQDFREAWWSDLRVVFERTDDVARLSSWSLGASPATGCFPEATTGPQGESMVVTADGIGIGSESDVVADHHFIVNQSSEGATIVNVNPISLSFADGQVSGISQSRADCFADTDDM